MSGNMKLSGNMIKRLMRRHHVTMREIKMRHKITLKRIREVRAEGVSGFFAEEWLFIITGKWPDGSKTT
jgi:hypothetical protein